MAAREYAPAGCWLHAAYGTNGAWHLSSSTLRTTTGGKAQVEISGPIKMRWRKVIPPSSESRVG